jgi:hypothetical protein
VRCVVCSANTVRCGRAEKHMSRVGQNRIYSPYMTDFPANNTVYTPYIYGSGQPYI